MPSPKVNQSKGGLLLAGDIGATNTRLALYAINGDLRAPMRAGNFIGIEYGGLIEILHEFLRSDDEPVQAACFGAAGPVVEDRVRLTNLPWVVDSAELLEKFGWQGVWLLNDLQAIANSVPLLAGPDLHTLKVGITEPRGNVAVIAPGTGLGIGYLTWAAGRYHPHATEGGHADFAPANALQDELLMYLRRTHPQVALEFICSGLGLPTVYGFLKETGRAEEPAWLTEKLDTAEDKTPIIVDHALALTPGSELCQQTLEIFVHVLAAEAGNLALIYGSTGGVYLAGGIPPRLLTAFQRYRFMEKFVAKTGYQYYLERFPVHVILNSEAGLMGAAAFGARQLLSAEKVR
jgi:glucokinase